MTQQDISDFLTGLGNVKTVIGSEVNGAPEISWGDRFYYITNTTGDSPKMPFVTVVLKDYPGFDEASKLTQRGLYRLNIDLGKEAFKKLFDYLPAEHLNQQDRFDYTIQNEVFPHPIYASYAWVSIINPSASSEARVKMMLKTAHERALGKFLNKASLL